MKKTAYFPVIYASSKLGKAGKDADIEKMEDITPIFDAILEYLPAPSGDPDKPLQMLVAAISADNFKGRIATGRIYNEKSKTDKKLSILTVMGSRKSVGYQSWWVRRSGKIKHFWISGRGHCGFGGYSWRHHRGNYAGLENPTALPLLNIEEPTVQMTFTVNDSPFAGREGIFKTSRQIRDRLFKELESDVALKVEDSGIGWVVSGAVNYI